MTKNPALLIELATHHAPNGKSRDRVRELCTRRRVKSSVSDHACLKIILPAGQERELAKKEHGHGERKK